MLSDSNKYAVRLQKANSHYQCQKWVTLYHMHNVFWLIWESSTKIYLIITSIYMRATLSTASVETERFQER